MRVVAGLELVVAVDKSADGPDTNAGPGDQLVAHLRHELEQHGSLEQDIGELEQLGLSVDQWRRAARQLKGRYRPWWAARAFGLRCGTGRPLSPSRRFTKPRYTAWPRLPGEMVTWEAGPVQG